MTLNLSGILNLATLFNTTSFFYHKHSIKQFAILWAFLLFFLSWICSYNGGLQDSTSNIRDWPYMSHSLFLSFTWISSHFNIAKDSSSTKTLLMHSSKGDFSSRYFHFCKQWLLVLENFLLLQTNYQAIRSMIHLMSFLLKRKCSAYYSS